LLEKSGIGHAEALLRSIMSEGSMRKACELDDEHLTARRNALVGHLGSLDLGRIKSIFETAEELSGNRDETLESLDMLLSFIRDTVYLSAGYGDSIISSIRPILENFAARFTLEQALQMLADIMETRRAIQRNANNKLAMDCLFMKLADTLT
jgi:DNA polymerase-3 subunit delta'